MEAESAGLAEELEQIPEFAAKGAPMAAPLSPGKY